MKKNIVYLILPITVIALVYGFQGNVLDVLARAITTVIEIPTVIDVIEPTEASIETLGWQFNHTDCDIYTVLVRPTEVCVCNPINFIQDDAIISTVYVLGKTVVTDINTKIYRNEFTVPWTTTTEITRQTETIITIETMIEVPDEVSPQTVPTRIPTTMTHADFLGRVRDVLKDVTSKSTTKMVGTYICGESSITVEPDWILIDAGPWMSFTRPIYESIDACGKPVIIHYTYQDVEYLTVIPANSNSVEWVNAEGYCGFLNVAKHCGCVGAVIEGDTPFAIEVRNVQEKYLEKTIGIKVTWNDVTKRIELK